MKLFDHDLNWSKDDIVGWLGISFVVMFIVAMGSVYVYVTGLPRPDPVTLCHPKYPAKSHTILLVDKTDPFYDKTDEKLYELIVSEKDKLPQFDRLSLYLVTGLPAAPVELLFSLCNPGTRETAKWYYQNPARVHRQFEEKFVAPLLHAMNELRNVQTAQQSPILEAIQSISTIAGIPPTGPNRRLIIVSDMLQNVPGIYRHYDNHDPYQDLRSTQYFKLTAPSLHGMIVTVHYIAREKYKRHQGNWHQAFWEAYFLASGVGHVSFIPFSAITSDGSDDDDDDDDD